MSFALDVKSDLLKVNNQDATADRLEIEALLRFGGEVVLSRNMKLNFTCNNMSVVRYLITLCKRYFSFEYEVLSRVVSRFDNHPVFTCEIANGADMIIKDVNLIGDASERRNQIEEGTFEETSKKMSAYLRGAFLVRGSVNDPMAKDSHLEIITNSESEILFIQKLMNHFELNARIAKRKNYLLAYIKAHEAIADFLYQMGASAIMNYYENAIITKEIKTTAIRSINLEIANQSKTNDAAVEQLKYIRYLEYNYPLERLDSKYLMVMKVRKDYPESSLNELLEVVHQEYDPSLTKSGLNHRFRKIKEIAIDYQNKKKGLN